MTGLGIAPITPVTRSGTKPPRSRPKEYPEHGDFTRWRFSHDREAVAAGRARVVGIRENGRLLNTVGLCRGDPDGDPVTLYRRLSFVPASYAESVIVPLSPGAHADG